MPEGTKPNILTAAGGGLTPTLSRVRGSRLTRRQGSGLFHEDAYTRVLNRLLRTEWNIIESYRLLQDHAFFGDLARTLQRRHADTGKALVNMIIAHRGLPDDTLTLGAEASLFFLHAARMLPASLAARTRIGVCRQLEKLLVARFGRALRVAPQRDVPTLKEMRRACLGNLERLSETLRGDERDDLA